ncbi:T9SS type A sorting domain-containing protein [Hymenobacter terricola]|uniref:T9SS type A sorting domain-containing protein n=1 Tax=Hymenobacter terricola TaxID=2819236 RepID=UPI001B311FD8|nr:T9SS type A sorting domain-containing protein [Hymenobacter terricola]
MLNCYAYPFRILLATLLLAFRLPATAQAPAWQSARAVAVATAAATDNFSAVTATAVDAAGNVYVAGVFHNTVVLGGSTLTSLGSDDMFVAKFNPVSNQFAWAQRAGGTGSEMVKALVVSGNSVYVAGGFNSPQAGFGTTTLTPTAGAFNSSDVFVAKLTDTGSAGVFAWAQGAGGAGSEYAYALAVSGANLYVTGVFGSNSASFGTTTLTNVGLMPTYDVFVAKLIDAGSTGNFVWAQQAGGANGDGAYALAVSGASLYVAGSFSSPTANFGTTSLANAGTSNLYVAKLTDAGSTGSFVWAQRAGGTGDDFATALAVSGASVYVAGLFRSPTAGFGPVVLANAGATMGLADVFVAKLTDAGSTGGFAWAQRAGGTDTDEATALAASGTSVYVTGTFGSSTAGFGSATLTNAGAGPGSFDVFVAKLTDAGSTGSFAWAQRAGGTGYDAATALAASGTGVYVAGYVNSPTAGFGTITLSNPTPPSTLSFLAVLTDPIPTATTAAGTRAPLALFPNPARRTVALRLPAGATPAPLTLTDALGRAVRQYPAPAGPEATLDLLGLPAGYYLLHGTGPALRLLVE